jgi:YHS domain-containing protein
LKALLVIVVISIVWHVLKRAIFFKFVRISSPNARGYGAGPRVARTGSVGEKLVKDEVCGSYVPLSAAISVDRNGAIEYFCSPECRDKFAAQGFSPD